MKDRETLPDRVPYPPAPWRLGGRMWSGIFRANTPVAPPSDLRPLIGGRIVGVALFRYEQGTLCYDELLVGLPVRCGVRPGLWVRDLWVSDPAALWGGRDIWELPKQAAEFRWSDSQVRVEDSRGPVATIRLLPRRRRLPLFWLPVPIVGGSPGRRCFAYAGWRGCLDAPGMSIAGWSERFPFRIAGKPSLGLGSMRFRVVVRAPRREGDH